MATSPNTPKPSTVASSERTPEEKMAHFHEQVMENHRKAAQRAAEAKALKAGATFN